MLRDGGRGYVCFMVGLGEVAEVQVVAFGRLLEVEVLHFLARLWNSLGPVDEGRPGRSTELFSLTDKS